MLKHIQYEHNGDKCDFTWKVMSKFKKPRQRQLTEAINIENRKKVIQMN